MLTIPQAIGLGSAVLGFMGQKDTNEANTALGREQMEFQERMSSTAYQRAVTDMQKSGLNPMLAYSQGGASSPVGAMPQVQNAVSAGAASASQSMNVLRDVQQLEATKAQIEKLKAETQAIKNNTLNPGRRDEEVYQRTNLTFQQQGESAARTRLLMKQEDIAKVVEALRNLQFDRDQSTFSADVARRKAESEAKVLDLARARVENKFYSDPGTELAPYLQRLWEGIKAIGSLRR